VDLAVWQVDIDTGHGTAIIRLFEANNRQFIQACRIPKADFVANFSRK
jgi:hypothetical protein